MKAEKRGGKKREIGKSCRVRQAFYYRMKKGIDKDMREEKGSKDAGE